MQNNPEKKSRFAIFAFIIGATLVAFLYFSSRSFDTVVISEPVLKKMSPDTSKILERLASSDSKPLSEDEKRKIFNTLSGASKAGVEFSEEERMLIIKTIHK